MIPLSSVHVGRRNNPGCTDVKSAKSFSDTTKHDQLTTHQQRERGSDRQAEPSGRHPLARPASMTQMCVRQQLQDCPTQTIWHAIDNRIIMSTTQGQPPNSAEQNDVVWSWVVWTSLRPSAGGRDCSSDTRSHVRPNPDRELLGCGQMGSSSFQTTLHLRC